MRVLVVQNFDDTGLGQVEAALAEAGAEIDLRMAHRGDALPATAEVHDAAVILGGGQNALADEEYPYIPRLLELARDFRARDRAMLGICLGSQLLARAFGGRNQIGGATEFGWCKVRLTEHGTEDPLLKDVPQEFPIFQWHDDTFSLPPDAVHLARNDIAANQAFRIGRAIYGIQFHFEADRKLVRDWSNAFAATIANRHPDWSERLEHDAASHGVQADDVGLAIARAWVDLI